MSKPRRNRTLLDLRARHMAALRRPELTLPTAPRIPAAGPLSPAIKSIDPTTRRMIDEALVRRRERTG